MINKNSTKAEVLKAVKQDWRALKFASEVLRNDREVVLTAVKQDGYALEYASWKLQNDHDFVVKAAKCMSDDSLYNIITDWIQTFCEN
jgi:hypothetical protein